MCKKNYICNPAKCNCENGKYVGRIIRYSVVICDETIDTTKFNNKKVTCKKKILYILLAFLLITIALLIAVSTYYYLIKYQAKQKNLLPFHFLINKLKETGYQKYIIRMENNDKF